MRTTDIRPSRSPSPPYHRVQPPAHQDRTGAQRVLVLEADPSAAQVSQGWEPVGYGLELRFVFCSFQRQSGGWRPGLFGTMLLDSRCHTIRQDTRNSSMHQDASAEHPRTKPSKWEFRSVPANASEPQRGPLLSGTAAKRKLTCVNGSPRGRTWFISLWDFFLLALFEFFWHCQYDDQRGLVEGGSRPAGGTGIFGQRLRFCPPVTIQKKAQVFPASSGQ